MEVYTVEEVANRLVFDSDIEAESDSDIEEYPDFPLPTLSSDDEEDGPASPSTGPASAKIKHTHYIYEELQWNPSIVDTIGELNFGLYRGVALSDFFFHKPR